MSELFYNSLLCCLYIGPISKKMRILVIIFLPISLNICFGCSKEPFHRDGSFEYPKHMFWLRNKKNNFLVRTLIWRTGVIIQVMQKVMTIIYTCYCSTGVRFPIILPAKSRSDIMFCLQSYGTYLS